MRHKHAGGMSLNLHGTQMWMFSPPKKTATKPLFGSDCRGDNGHFHCRMERDGWRGVWERSSAGCSHSYNADLNAIVVVGDLETIQ